MAAYTGVLTQTPLGHNLANLAFSEHVLEQALANTDTLTLDIPAGYKPDSFVPLEVKCFNNATPRVPQTNFSVTSYNATTGKLILTASGAVADASTFVVMWVPASVGS